MAFVADRAFVLHGVKSPLRKKLNGYLTNSQRTFTTHQQRDIADSAKALMDDKLKEMHVADSSKDCPSIDELEQSLSELKVQVKGLAESLSPELLTEYKKIGETDSILRSSGKNGDLLCSTGGTFPEEDIVGQATNPDESEWFLRPRHLVQSLGRYPALEDLGVPVHSLSPVDRMVGLTGSELSSKNNKTSTISPVDIAYRESFPLKFGAPHVIGVRALRPPQIPVRPQSPEWTRSPFLRDQAQTLRRPRSIRSRSLSPASKRSRWLQSCSESPKPVWRPNSMKVNACGQPPPPINRQRSGSKKISSNRLTHSYSYKPGKFNSSSQRSSQSLDDSSSSLWTSRRLVVPPVSSLSAQEINERYEMKGSHFHYEAHKNHELL
ncbi:uncharacterized protein LOC125486658 isoform X2 [Rhincodon typus]|uniref:uncharacterized protein LOC125486658 isoform X2 n=1 Tax=Rhincodon typus TaxID=259920 RepID=UPI002030A356|nr:uncharacterized protein LOC125486658 isoform X2 [Rhincodon typus]